LANSIKENIQADLKTGAEKPEIPAYNHNEIMMMKKNIQEHERPFFNKKPKMKLKQIKIWQDPKTIIELTQSFGGPGFDAQKVSV
jgi:hypothetical protein